MNSWYIASGGSWHTSPITYGPLLVVKQSPYGVPVNVSSIMTRPSWLKVTLAAVEHDPMMMRSPVPLERCTHCPESTRSKCVPSKRNSCAASLLHGAMTSCVLLVVSRHTSAPEALTPCSTNACVQLPAVASATLGGSGGGGNGGGGDGGCGLGGGDGGCGLGGGDGGCGLGGGDGGGGLGGGDGGCGLGGGDGGGGLGGGDGGCGLGGGDGGGGDGGGTGGGGLGGGDGGGGLGGGLGGGGL